VVARWLRLGAVGLVVAACGATEKTNSAGDRPAAPAATIAPPDIAEPANGDTVTASARLGDNISAKVRVRGTAEPGRSLRVSAGCQVVGCIRTVTAGEDGRFSVGVNVTVDVAEPSIPLVAEYEDSYESDRVVITVGEPTPAPSRRKRPRRTATPGPGQTGPTATPPRPRQTPTAQPGATGGRGSAVIVGDSLAQGIEPYMTTALAGWSVSVDARIGRPLSEGMRIFSDTPIRPGTVYAFSLFTNDDPRSVPALEQAVRASVSRAGCAVWATIVRPPEGGVGYDAANRALTRLAAGPLVGRLQIVDWAGAVAAHPDWISGNDRVHGTPEGYRNRAALYARAIRACPH
jgi:hypothetical protein